MGVTTGEAARRSSAVAGAAPTTSVAATTAVMPAPAMVRWNDMVLRFCGDRIVRQSPRAVTRVCEARETADVRLMRNSCVVGRYQPTLACR